ncbi:MAG: hypothetical protein RIF41_31940 [Polyangiaceae bacterium]
MKTNTTLLGAALVSLLAAAACNGSDDVTAECEPFLDTTEEATPLTIAIENNSPDPIYLVSNGCSTDVELILRDPNGDFVPRFGGACGNQTCEVLMDEPVLTCDAACAVPPTVMIAPGGRFETEWDGFVMKQVEMPSSCFADTQSQLSTCAQLQVAEEGSYSAGFNVATEITCQSGDPNDNCDCTPDENGLCTIDFGYAETMTETLAEALYPSETAIEIVYGDGLGS